MLKLFLKGFIIGIGKIIPGLSGSLLAINFNVYERAIKAISTFFSDWKENLRFLVILGTGIFLAIVMGSKIIIYLLNNYKFITLMFFIGLILGGTKNFSKTVNYNKKSIIIIIITFILFSLLSLGNISNKYILHNNYLDILIFILGGFIEIIASIVPGISGTALLMICGIYEKILEMTSLILNYQYVINNIRLYLSYGFGMFISFIVTISLINYLLNNKKEIIYPVILGLALSSIVFLIIYTYMVKLSIVSLIIGLLLLIIGLKLSVYLEK